MVALAGQEQVRSTHMLLRQSMESQGTHRLDRIDVANQRASKLAAS